MKVGSGMAPRQAVVGTSVIGILLAIHATGCGGPSGIPKHAPVYQVHGEVTINGQPASKGVMMEFIPSSYTSGALDAHGAVQDDDGQYWATTFRDERGLIPGEYKVLLYGKGVPKKYISIETTDLTATVKAEDNPIDFELTGGEDSGEEGGDSGGNDAMADEDEE